LAWKVATGAGMIVGVIDSGVDYNHPALSSNIYVNSNEIPGNGIDDDNNGFIDDVAGYDFGQDDASPFDDFGHGTHVAGIAASNIFGAAKKARILPTKFGAGLGFDIASVTGAIKYSVDRGAKVLNMSFGWEDDLAVVREAMNYAESKDVLVVAASGNDTVNNDLKPSFPCNYKNKNIISIAATDENDKITFYSNFGNSVHLGAPGGTPEKPIISSYKKNPRNDQFVGLMGTSMASPLVAGVAAQIWSANPNLTAVQIRTILIDSGKPIASLKGRISSGKVIDTLEAMKQVLATRLESSRQP
ncbi:MAG: S8 family serine peptidase, partial [Bdellovibrionales bacterium]|nr:S8 family serine peptidase [Bdellovibrionales bacterium]